MISNISVDELSRALEGLNASTAPEAPDQREQLKRALFLAHRRLQSPFDVALAQVWNEPAAIAAIKTLIDASVWKKWAASGRESSTVKELSELSGFEETLLRRLLRMIAGQGYVEEPAPDTFATTSFSKALGDSLLPSVYPFFYEFNQPCFANLPKFFSKTIYKNPTDVTNGNFQDWQGPGVGVFDMIKNSPDFGMHFNNAMTLYAESKLPWTSVYPVENIIKDAKPGRALVVDVGGNVGHDLEKFRLVYPYAPSGSLIVQDLPEVIATTKPTPPCIAQAHDAFTPQPVKGARVYYLHTVLHDWPEAQAIDILRNLTTAMEKGYSKILLYEAVITESGAKPHTTMSDLTMMAFASSLERTEGQWRELVRKAGCEIVKIWSRPDAKESVIEVDVL